MCVLRWLLMLDAVRLRGKERPAAPSLDDGPTQCEETIPTRPDERSGLSSASDENTTIVRDEHRRSRHPAGPEAVLRGEAPIDPPQPKRPPRRDSEAEDEATHVERRTTLASPEVADAAAPAPGTIELPALMLFCRASEIVQTSAHITAISRHAAVLATSHRPPKGAQLSMRIVTRDGVGMAVAVVVSMFGEAAFAVRFRAATDTFRRFVAAGQGGGASVGARPDLLEPITIQLV